MKRLMLLAAGAWLGCSSSPSAGADGGSDGANDVVTSGDGGDGGTATDGATNPMGLACAVTKAVVAPNACPAPSGASGKVSFCFRAQWAGVTSVDVLGAFGQSTDWTMPFVSLTNDGTGSFTATASLASGSYPYVFRVSGSADNLFHSPTFLLDQEATQFTPAPPMSPIGRSLPVVTVPQSTTPPALHHLRGKVVYNGEPQPCFSVAVDVGEMYKDGGGVLSEQSTANYMESGPDGAFDFPIASGPVMAVVRYPFLLTSADAGYPTMPSQIAAMGYARTGSNLAAGDVVLDPVEVSYPAADYGKMSPTSGTPSLPTTFTYSVVPGSTSASVAVIGTNIAGNDPSFWSPFGSATSLTWDGGFGGTQGSAIPGKQYWWGTWQKRLLSDGGTVWSEESLLFPITFQ
jgi:hypothetical protein